MMTPTESILLGVIFILILMMLQWSQHKIGFFDYLAFIRKVKFKLAIARKEKKMEDRRLKILEVERKLREKIANANIKRESKELLKANRAKTRWMEFTIKQKYYMCFLASYLLIIVLVPSTRYISFRDILNIFASLAVIIVIYEMAAAGYGKAGIMRTETIAATIERIPEHKKPEIMRLIKRHTEEKRQIEGVE